MTFSSAEGRGRPVGRALSPGRHEIVVSGEQGEIERFEANIERQGLLAALVDPLFYVYNVSEAHVYSRGRHVYAVNPQERERQETLIGFARFFSQAEVDYLFTQVPETLRTESSRLTKSSFSISAEGYNGLAETRYAQGRKDEAERALRREAALRPCYARARRNLVNLLAIGQRYAEALETATEWVASCGASEVEPHRAYQDLLMGGEGWEKLRADYRARLAANPDVGMNHYLYGRLLGDPEASQREHREALRLDPNLAWARVALGYDLLALEQAGEAFRELTFAMSSPEHAPEAAYPYALAAVGAGSQKDAQPLLARLALQHSQDAQVWEALWLMELVSERWSVAERMVTEQSARESASDAWQHRLKLLRLRGVSDQVSQAVETAEGQAELAEALAVVRFERLFEGGRYREAASALAEESEEGGAPLYHLYSAAGLLMAGEAGSARRQLDRIQADPGASPTLKAMARSLRGEISPQELLRTARAEHFMMLPHAYFMLGARATYQKDRAAAAGFFERSFKTSLDLDFPFEAARRLAGVAEQAKRSKSVAAAFR